MDYGVLNSMRVGAIGGLAARALAPEGARVLGMIGSGWQAHTQVQAVRRALPGWITSACSAGPRPTVKRSRRE